MTHRVGYRHGTALRNAEKRKALEPGSIDYGLEIADENLERNLFDLAIGKAIAARVIADQRVIARQVAIEAAPDRGLEIEFEMRHPVSGLDQRRSAAGSCISELDPIRRYAELDLLLVRLKRSRRWGIRCG